MACNTRNQHSAIRFFKIITTTSLEAGKIKLPDGFVKKYSGDMSNPVFLNPPDDTNWEIHWSKHDSDIWFQKGWEEFAKYYSLDHGHLVSFEFKDASHFGVHIFDKSTLEIEYPMIHGNQDEQNNNLDQMSDNSVEIPPCKKTKRKSPISCPQPCKKLRTCTSKDVGRSPKLQKFPKQVKLEDDADGTTECLKGECFTSKTTKALKRTGTRRSGNYSFTVVMTPTYVDGYGYSLWIPARFAKQHLKKKREIILQVLDGRTWSVNYSLGKFCAGWKTFALDNKLNVGDVCRFELMLNKRRCLSFEVSIIPLVGKSHSHRS